MKSILLALALTLAAPFVQAQSVSTPVKTSAAKRDLASGDYFDFQVASYCVGCISFVEYLAAPGFPHFVEGTATKVRLYYSNYDFSDISMASPYLELGIQNGPGGVSLPTISFGNWPSGQRVYFKVALVADSGRMIFMTPNSSSDYYRHSVLVR